MYKETGIAGDIKLAENSITTLMDMSVFAESHIPGLHTLDFGASTTHAILAARKFSGGIIVKNINTDTKLCTIEFDGGRIVIDSSCIAGTLRIAGLPDTAIIDNSNGTTVYTDGILPGAESVANIPTAAEINAEVSDVLKVDKISEMSQGDLPEEPTMEFILNCIYRQLANEIQTTKTETATMNHDGTLKIHKSPLINTDTLFTKFKAISGE